MRSRWQATQAFALTVLGAATMCGLAARGSAEEAPPLRSAAPGPAVQLTYVRQSEAASCPSDSSLLEHEVRSRIGYDPFGSEASRRLSVRLERRGTTLHALIELLDEIRASDLRQDLAAADGDCRALIERVALVVALAIAPPRSPAPAPPASAEPPALDKTAIRQTASPRAAGRAAASKLSFGLAAGGALDVGSAPIVAAVPLVAGEARWSTFSLGLEAHWSLPAQGSTQGGGAVRVSAIEGRIDLCLRAHLLGVCALAASGVESVSGRGFRDPTSGSAGLLSLGARVLSQVPLPGAFELWFFADVVTPLVRPSAVVGAENGPGVGQFQAWRSPDVSLRLGTAIGLSIH